MDMRIWNIPMSRKASATISSQALLHNFQVVKQKAPQSKILAMVKANAYGHGMVTVANILQTADALGVANIEEALILRQAGILTPIVLMEGFFNQEELGLILEYQLTPVIHHLKQVEALEAIAPKINIWIKINTGMNRLGFKPSDFNAIYARLKRISSLNIIGFMTHFAQADEIDNLITQDQKELFLDTVKTFPGQKCLANSAAILAWPDTHFDWVRPGLMLYGVSPFSQSTGKNLGLMPAMQLIAEVIAVQSVSKGECVGYGGSWEAQSETTRVGIVSIGYGDGYPWHARSGTPVLVNDEITQIVGRISMDMLAVDLTQLPRVRVGDPVQLWGGALPIELVAKGAATIPYELLCRLTDRVNIQIK